MITKSLISKIKSLHDKKHRQKTNLFLVEGEKSVIETINSDYKIEILLSTKSFYTKNSKLINEKKINYEIVEQGEIEKVSSLESNDSALATVFQKKAETIENKIINEEIILVLDNIRDPGNLGTIIRVADWYGIKKIIASVGTVDLYNPKVISATKGSFTRINITYTDLTTFLKGINLPILGAFLKGENIHHFKFPKRGLLIIGNESNGIDFNIKKYITTKITIPAFSQTESLNAAIATGIIIDNWKRNN